MHSFQKKEIPLVYIQKSVSHSQPSGKYKLNCFDIHSQSSQNGYHGENKRQQMLISCSWRCSLVIPTVDVSVEVPQKSTETNCATQVNSTCPRDFHRSLIQNTTKGSCHPLKELLLIKIENLCNSVMLSFCSIRTV